jgi:hypothetical protein
VDEVRAWIEAETLEPDGACRRLEGGRSWFDMAMSNAIPSRWFDAAAAPPARLCSGLR